MCKYMNSKILKIAGVIVVGLGILTLFCGNCCATKKSENFNVTDSKAITSFTHHPASDCIDVTFTTGRVYRYLDVEPTICNKFKDAESKGSFFHKNILNKYSFEEIQ